MTSAGLFAALAAPGALGQAHSAYLQFPSGNVYSGSTAIKVELWIQFEKPTFTSLAGWKGGVIGGAGSHWSNSASPLFKPGMGMSLGEQAGTNVAGIVLGQLGYIPPGPTVPFQITSSPILIRSADWTTSDLTPRNVAVQPATLAFRLYDQTQFVSHEQLGNLTDLA